MNQQVSLNTQEIDALVAELNTAYANNELDGYRALELKGSFNEETSCALQWGPQMRT